MKKKLMSVLIALGYFGLFYAVQFAVLIPAMLIMAIIGSSGLNSSDSIAVFTMISNLLAIACFMLITKLRKQKIREEYYLFKAPVLKLIILVAAGILLNIFISFLLEFLSETFPLVNKCMKDYEEQSSVLTDMSPAMYAVFGVVLAPVMEEFIFRGGIYRVVRKECSFAAAAFVSSLFFGVAHANLVWSTYAFLLGMILCGVYEKYHSIAANIVLHLSFNLTSTFIEKVFSDADTLQTRDYITGTLSGVIAVILLIVLFVGKKNETIQPAVSDKTN